MSCYLCLVSQPRITSKNLQIKMSVKDFMKNRKTKSNKTWAHLVLLMMGWIILFVDSAGDRWSTVRMIHMVTPVVVWITCGTPGNGPR